MPCASPVGNTEVGNHGEAGPASPQGTPVRHTVDDALDQGILVVITPLFAVSYSF